MLRPAILLTSLLAIGARGADDPASVEAIQERHDRALINDLRLYLEAHPEARDRDAGYLKLFETAIEHDWFAENEGLAAAYLNAEPRGGVAPMARIVATMARARRGDFAAAGEGFRRLLSGLDDERQVAFAVDFAQSLAGEAIVAGEVGVAADVYKVLLDRFGSDPELRRDIAGWQARLELVGRQTPDFGVNDLDGTPIRLAELRGKTVLLDFWATWCAPAIQDRPALLETYRNHHADGFEVISISLDDEVETARSGVKNNGWPWRHVHAGSAGVDLVELYRIGQIPASVLIGPDGRVERLDLKAAALDAILKSRPAR